MKTAVREMKWETSKGEAIATITATAGNEKQETVNFADGLNIKTEKLALIDTLTVVVAVSGQTISGYPMKSQRDGIAAIIASKIGLTADVYKKMMGLIGEAKKEAREDSDYQARIENNEKRKAEMAELDKHIASVKRAMGSE